MKRVLVLMLTVVLAYACGNQTKQAEEAVETRTIAELVSAPLDFEGKTVQFTGLIGHMCRNSGDKMRIVQMDDSAYSIQVMLGEMASQFSPEMEGSEIVITGVLMATVTNMDALAHEHGEDCDHEEGEECEDDHAHEDGHECETTLQAVEMLKQKGIDPKISVNIQLVSFEVK